jgi:hypothetical protein
MPAGSRPASSQPSSTAMSGMPTRIHSRFATGMLVSRDAVDHYLAAGRLLQGPGDGQQRALTRAARPHHRHHRALIDRQADVSQRVHPAVPCP